MENLCADTAQLCLFSSSRGVNCLYSPSCGVAHLHSGYSSWCAGSPDGLLFSPWLSAMNPCLGSPFGRDQLGEDVFSFACVGLEYGGMSNHRESSCSHIEKLQLHDVNLKAAEPLMVASVVCVTAHPSEHSLPIYVHLSGINCARVLRCVHCLRTGDLVLASYVSDVEKPSVTFNFLLTTSAPVFAPKFLGRLSTHLLQGGPALNSQCGE